MRASLLANATASLFLCNRSDAELSHGPKLYRAQLCGRISRTFAAWISSVRRYLLPGNAAEDRPAARTVLLRHETPLDFSQNAGKRRQCRDPLCHDNP